MENEGLEATKRLKWGYAITQEERIYLCECIEKELKAKANLVSMCENLAKLVGLKEKDYVELETLITKKLKTLEQLEIMYSNCAIEGAKQKKVLEIINKKCSANCNLALVKDSQNYKVYNEQFDYFLKKWQEHAGAFEIVEEDRLSEFEYNILREWLLEKENAL